MKKPSTLPLIRASLALCSLVALPVVGETSSGPTEVRQLAITHSGAYDLFYHNDAPVGDSLYPYVTRMAEAGGQTYRLDGTFFAFMDRERPLPKQVAEATVDGFVSQWRSDSDTPLDIHNVPGETFAAKDYDSFIVSPRNFIQVWFDEEKNEMIRDGDGNLVGINPTTDPARYEALVQEYVEAFNYLLERNPDITLHIYIFLPPAVLFFSHTEDASQDNTVTLAHVEAYTDYALGIYQQWFDHFLQDLRDHPDMTAGDQIVPVEVSRIVAELLAAQPDMVVGRDWFDFARDGAPHFGDLEGDSDFFEAIIAPILYTELFRQRVPESFELGAGNIFAPYFEDIVEHVYQQVVGKSEGS